KLAVRRLPRPRGITMRSAKEGDCGYAPRESYSIVLVSGVGVVPHPSVFAGRLNLAGSTSSSLRSEPRYSRLVRLGGPSQWRSRQSTDRRLPRTLILIQSTDLGLDRKS